MSESFSSYLNILDMPDEILLGIIVHLNLRERAILAKSCRKFNSLVFEDKILMRDLDFSNSEESHPSSPADIQQYFRNENGCKHVLKMTIRNIRWTEPGQPLNDTIGKAINLVDMNIKSIIFDDMKQLDSFLKPLLHLKRLSIVWPRRKVDGYEISQNILNRFTYLSVKLHEFLPFLPTIKLCPNLRELHISGCRNVRFGYRGQMMNPYHSAVSDSPRSLRIVHVYGRTHTKVHLEALDSILPDCQEWMSFESFNGFHFGMFPKILKNFECNPHSMTKKNVEVCEYLRGIKSMQSFALRGMQRPIITSWLISTFLLNESIKITHEDVPESFCCLTLESILDFYPEDTQPCLLRIAEAKRLLEDPAYQISFLQFTHNIEADCDVHLVASAFPNLNELVIRNVIRRDNTVTTPRKHIKRRLRKKGSVSPEERDDSSIPESSFEMLIENTPNLTDLTILCQPNNREELLRWDWDAMYLIPRWKNLSILQLAFLPPTDEKFLPYIGQECPKLEKIILVGFQSGCCYMGQVSQMLSHCRNLKEFSISQFNSGEVSELFSSLSNNQKLKIVRVINYHEQRYDFTNLMSSIEQMIRCCLELSAVVYNRRWEETDTADLVLAIERLKVELDRPNLQFRIAEEEPYDCEDASLSFFCHPFHDNSFHDHSC